MPHRETDRHQAAGTLTRPAGHEAKAEAGKNEAEDEAEAQIFFETEATMYEAEVEVRHVREQLSVYEHGVQNIVFSKLLIHNKNDCR